MTGLFWSHTITNDKLCMEKGKKNPLGSWLVDRVGKKCIALWLNKKKWKDSWVLVFSSAKWSYYALLKFKSDIRGQIIFNDANHVKSTQ